MKRRFHWLGRVLMGLLVCLCLSTISGAAPSQLAQNILNQVLIRPILDSGTFQVDGQTFQHILVPQSVLDECAESDFAVYSGETHDLVRQWKLFLYSNANFPSNEFVTYSQVRPPNTRDDIDSDYWIEGDDYEDVLYYFDDHLKSFLETVYLFCGMEGKEPCLDALTCHLLENLPYLSVNMLQDIERVYKYNLAVSGTAGTVARDGKLDNLYYFAQTDPDWADMIFEYNNNGDTVRDRGCGCACAAMIVSTYWNVEITPRWMRNIALTGDWPVDYGLPNDYFHDVAEQYSYYARYEASLKQPRIIKKDDLDIDELARLIGEEGYLAIIHVDTGAFTSHEHYMVLADYEVFDGQGYFLVADPYELQSRYKNKDQMRPVEYSNQEGLIYATKELLYRDCKSIILFEQDRRDFRLFSRCTEPERLAGPGG